MFNIGDEVRLARGWTRLVVIGFHPDGRIIAKYDSETYADMNRVKDWDFRNPLFASGTQKRIASDFVRWDGAPIKKVHYTMQDKVYRLKADHKVKGILRGHAGNGNLLIEGPDGEIYNMEPRFVELDLPFTFSVKSTTNSGYTAHYILPAGASVRVGDLLHSNGGHTYRVTAIDTRAFNNKGTFKGVRLLTEPM